MWASRSSFLIEVFSRYCTFFSRGLALVDRHIKKSEDGKAVVPEKFLDKVKGKQYIKLRVYPHL
jgi:hypothetical protein